MILEASTHYRKTRVCRVPGSLPSAESRALGKATICRVPNNMHSANNWHSAEYLFAEYRPDGTRQRHTLPSAIQLTLGKERHCTDRPQQTTEHNRRHRRRPLRAFVCRVPTWWHSAKRSLPSALQSTLGKLCHVHRTRQLPKAVTLLPRTFPFFHGRYRYSSPSAKLGHSANIL